MGNLILHYFLSISDKKVVAIWYVFFCSCKLPKKKNRIRCDLRDRPILRGKSTPAGNFNLTIHYTTGPMDKTLHHILPTKEKRSSRILSNLKHFHVLLWFRNAARTNHMIFSIGWTESTPKTNMEPENHSFEKETHLPNLHFFWLSMLIFGGAMHGDFEKWGNLPKTCFCWGHFPHWTMIVGVMYLFLNNLSMLLTCNSKKLQLKALVLNPSIMDKCFIESRSSEHSTNKTRPPCKSVIFVSSSFSSWWWKWIIKHQTSAPKVIGGDPPSN